MRATTLFILTLFFLSCNNGGNVQNMTKKLDKLDKDELEMMVENAKKEIDKENFSKASEILDEAKVYVTDDEDKNLLAETNTYYKDEKSAYDKKKRRERQRRTSGNNSSSYSSGSSSSGCKDWAVIEFTWGNLNTPHDPELSVQCPDYVYSDINGSNASVNSHNGCIKGTYRFTLSRTNYSGLQSAGRITQSGSFYIDGTSRNYTINITDYNINVYKN